MFALQTITALDVNYPQRYKYVTEENNFNEGKVSAVQRVKFGNNVIYEAETLEVDDLLDTLFSATGIKSKALIAREKKEQEVKEKE